MSSVGSTVVHPYNDKSLTELEVGASIFVSANKNLWRASDEFNLTRRDFSAEEYETGIWDGTNLAFSVRSSPKLSMCELIVYLVFGWMVGRG